MFPLLGHAEIIIAEGESFTPLDKRGWKVTHQQDSYGSHTYGGMWMTHGGCLGAPADSVDSIAKKTIAVKDGGTFRVWSKYQAPPYFQLPAQSRNRTGWQGPYSRTSTARKGPTACGASAASPMNFGWPWASITTPPRRRRRRFELTPGVGGD